MQYTSLLSLPFFPSIFPLSLNSLVSSFPSNLPFSLSPIILLYPPSYCHNPFYPLLLLVTLLSHVVFCYFLPSPQFSLQPSIFPFTPTTLPSISLLFLSITPPFLIFQFGTAHLIFHVYKHAHVYTYMHIHCTCTCIFPTLSPFLSPSSSPAFSVSFVFLLICVLLLFPLFPLLSTSNLQLFYFLQSFPYL